MNDLAGDPKYADSISDMKKGAKLDEGREILV